MPSPSRAVFGQAPARQRGVAMLEFLIVSLPLLALGLGSVEFAHWQLTRQAIDYALMEAAREGAVTHGDPQAMRRRFDSAVLPLFGGGTTTDALAATAARVAARAAAIEADAGVPAMRLEVLSPSRASFTDFADPALGSRFGRRAIDNDYLAEGHARDLARGWPGGRGPASGHDRFDANSLRLRLTWLHPPLLPGMRTLLQALAGEADPPSAAADAYTAQARARAGMLVITREFSMTMQSHPVEWTEDNYRAAWGAARIGTAPMASVNIGGVSGNSGTPGTPGMCAGSACASGPAETPGTSPWSPPGSPGVVQPGDPACGITVCCGPA